MNRIMKIILTDRAKDCPDTVPAGYELIQVNRNSIDRYSGNEEVEIVIGTRGFARLLKNFNFPGLKLVQLFSVGYDDLDLNWFKNKGVTLCNGGGYMTVC